MWKMGRAISKRNKTSRLLRAELLLRPIISASASWWLEEEEEKGLEMEGDRVKDEALRLIGVFEVLPRLVVFDLDYTLWPFYCEMRSKWEVPRLYREAYSILHALNDKGIELAIASRSPTPDIANTFLNKLGIQSMFLAKEIFSSWTHKTEHFEGIHRRTGVPFESMLFFDDEYRNIDSVSRMGVTSILVDNGVNLRELRIGLEKFAEKSKQQENNEKST
ncbi:hypothetical protein AXF42_Ash020860 [Apostasia shenzhenica]|uniref:Magnesium-dependent phosphatase 1 n=1 Tax=Apostasia shenzhenica TaxID=1088818 RepID=A0A2H9ZSR3_9ASPA|nr:hypothetical protein AXF42_Ash020860 [Apostasia shenzhenica]